MVININEYYKHEIDKVKEGFTKNNYEVKSTYIFFGLYTLIIAYEFTLLKTSINILTIMIYALPLCIGTFIELHAKKSTNH